MIKKVPEQKRRLVEPFFKQFDDTMIRTYLEGHMGEAWVDDLDQPTAAQITVSVFTFFSGDARSTAAEALLKNVPEDVLVIVETDEWKQELESVHAGHYEKYSRYRFEQSQVVLDPKHLKAIIDQLPSAYTLRKIDKAVIEMPSLHHLSPDFTGNFESAEDYLDRGIGYVVIHEDKVVSGASSFSIYDGGIEIEVGTDEGYRRQGLAAIVSAALIRDCLYQNRYPNWDAENIGSAKLAQSLGYSLKEPYDTYYVNTHKKAY
ncbi:GNAT family N-acetyltransferase [Marinilactibacillus kalidii]|uniref:GNAT family N-acetyltransferase n=1 Tax=Marinilactibacillus kalidii TaxID=2820274 RepID=UPI001ABE2EA1|nr:GNAT family N-acetyltransferase [Marinilactibacillus kalidii]